MYLQSFLQWIILKTNRKGFLLSSKNRGWGSEVFTHSTVLRPDWREGTHHLHTVWWTCTAVDKSQAECCSSVPQHHFNSWCREKLPKRSHANNRRTRHQGEMTLTALERIKYTVQKDELFSYSMLEVYNHFKLHYPFPPSQVTFHGLKYL